MSKFILEKAVEKTKFVLEKKNIKNIRAQIAVNLDVSGSTQNMYYAGQFQEAFQQIMPVAILFDDNGEIDTFTFSNDCQHLDVCATEDNFASYIKDEILEDPSVDKWHGTTYAGVIKQNLSYFGFYTEEKSSIFSIFRDKKTVLQEKSSSGLPVIVYIFTDGENTDKVATEQLLAECERVKCNIYFHFIGIGQEGFGFIKDMADQFPNVGFASIKDFNSAGNEDFIDILLCDELCQYLRK